MFKLGTLFSGIGSPEFGLDKLNIKYTSAFACEIDSYARKSFLANHNIDENLFFKDVYKIEEKDIEKDIDLLVAGFPCQTFSSAGKGLGIHCESGRGLLYKEMLKVIKFSKPKTIILENVKGILFDKHKLMRDDLYKNLTELGYYFKETVLNTKIHSEIPQSRNRWFLVGFLDEKSFNKYEFPKEIKVEDINNYIKVNEKIDEKYYYSPYRFLKHFFINLSDNTNGVVSTFTSAREYDGFHNYSPTLLASEYKCPKVIKTKPLNFIKKYFIDNGFNFENYKTHLEDNILNGRTINKMLLKDFDLNVAISFGFNYDKFKTFYRMMTPREALNLQGFPKDFKVEVSDSQLYKQAGNSMTVDIMTKIISSTLKANK